MHPARRPADLGLEGTSDDERPIPVRLAHVTRPSENLVCRAGLRFDVLRMQSEDVARLLRVWRTLLARVARTGGRRFEFCRGCHVSRRRSTRLDRG